MKIVAVTSCATGIAHTYMAAEALERAARAAGHEIWVETQGAGGLKPIPADVIAGAEVCIFANDVEVRDAQRFHHLPIINSSPKQAIKNAAILIADAEALLASE